MSIHEVIRINLSKFTNAVVCLFAFNFSFLQGQIITTVAGNGTQGYSGDGGLATNAELYWPAGISFDKHGNLYIADYGNYRVRKISTTGTITTIAGNGTAGYGGDGGPASLSVIDLPTYISVDTSVNIYFSEGSHRIRKISSSGIITTFAGTGVPGFSGDGGPATLADVNLPGGVATDKHRNIYIGDSDNNRIRIVDTGGIINTIGGNGTPGYLVDGVSATTTEINHPIGVRVDKKGNVYFADRTNNRIRKIDTAGIITTVAGNGTLGFSGDGGLAINAQLHAPYDVEVDSIGNIYIADYINNRIRKVNTAGTISTIAGNGTAGFSGDGGNPLLAELNQPIGLAIDALGNLYISDINNNRIRKISFNTMTGITEIDNSFNVGIYPNPTKDVVNISLVGNGYNSIKITDVVGRVIYFNSLDVAHQNIKIQINLEEFSNGIYFVQFSTIKGVVNKRIEIQK